MFKKLLGRVAAVAIAAGVCLGAFNVGSIETKAKTEFFEKSGVQSFSLNSKVQGSITTKRDQRWYQFNTLADDNNWYTFDFKAVDFYDVYFAIYDADGANIRTEECYDSRNNKKYVTKLDANSTYYIQVYGYENYVGGFVFSVNSEADEGSTNETATPIGSDYTGILAHGTDADVLAFNSGSNTACTVTVKNIDGYYSIGAQIFKADGTKVDDSFRISRASATSQTVLLKQNTTYYIKVLNDSDNNRSTYKISITGRKDEPNTRKSSQKVKAKKNIKGVLDTGKDEDWFKVKLNKKKNWKFILKNIDSDDTVYMTVYKGNKQLAYTYAGKANNSSMKKVLKKGTYYIKISAGHGNYAFKVK